MLSRDSGGRYVSSLLASIPGISHGFATRHADSWPENYFRVQQIHSAEVVRAEHVSAGVQADAIITAERSQWIGIRTADCVPVLLADRGGRAVAAVHAGWRGAAAGILTETVRRLSMDLDCSPRDIVAAVGPCIGFCCFEVGPEVAAMFSTDTNGRLVDLASFSSRQLVSAGVPEMQIDRSELCTMCSEKEFHSWRRDREVAGRMVSAIRID